MMQDIHVRFVKGEKIIYDRFRDRVGIITMVYDQTTPVCYDIKVPIYAGECESYLSVQKVSPRELRAVEDIML